MSAVAEPRARTRVSAETADRLLYLASRAPSPHNAQGWRIEVDGARFRVSLDPDRQVMAGLDPQGLEGELACGAAVENLRAGAEALGYAAKVAWRPAPGVLAEVTLEGASGAHDAARLAAIRDRAMNRSLYTAEPVAPELLAELRGLAAEQGFGLAIATEPAAIAEIAVLAADAGAAKLAHDATRRELHELMRYTGAAGARARDGLDLELFFAPRGAALAMHPRSVSALGLAPKLAREADERPIRSAPAVCLLHGAGEDAFLRGGACFEALALRLTEAGLAHALHSAPIELGLADPACAYTRLLHAFGAEPGARPIALFRIGTPAQRPRRRSLRRPLAAAPPEHDLYRELTLRNRPAIPPADQAKLRAVRVLFAGCGSIGGAPVEPLVRMGVERLVLAEPGDYEANNLNRQAAVLADIGRNKAAVLADRARAINPHVHALVEPSGVTAENVDWLVGTTDVIVDGVDVTEASGIAAKRLLHEEAWRQRRLVIAGLDLGGTQLVYAFDYRDPKVRPFWGRLDGLGQDLDALGLLSRLIDPLDMPLEMLGYAESVIRGRDDSPPQLAPTADQFGVLAAWAVLDFACGRTLRRKAGVAIPNLLMPRSRRVRTEAARLAKLARIKLMLEVKRARQGV